MTITNADITQAKLDPASVFARPSDVLAAPIDKADKRAILQRWEADADALLRAGDEGMSEDPASAVLVQAVQAALEALAAEAD